MDRHISIHEFIEKYGDVPVSFSGYYKYVFSFTGQHPNGLDTIRVDVGGTHDEIYRFEVSTESVKIRNLGPFAGYVTSNGEIVEEFYQPDW